MDDFLKDLIKESKREAYKEKLLNPPKPKVSPIETIVQWEPISLACTILRQECTSCGSSHQSFQGLLLKERHPRNHSTRVSRQPWQDSFLALPLDREEIHEEIAVCGECLPVSILIARALTPQPQMELF